MADDDVLIKIATDVGSTTAAMGTLIQLVAQMNEQFVLAREEAKATGEAIVGAMEVGSRSTQESSESAVAWGTQWSQIIDEVQTALWGLIKSFPELVNQTIAAGDAAYTMSKRLSLSVETIGKLDYLAEVGGGNLNQLARTVQDLGRSLQDSGSQGAKGLEKLGLNIQTLKTQGDEAFFTIIETLQDKFPDAAERAAAAQEIFGRKFANNTQLLSENMEKVRADVARINSGINESTAGMADNIGDSWLRAGLGADAFRDRMVGHLLPAIESVSAGVEQLPQGLLFLGQQLGQTAQAMAPMLGNLATMVGKKGLEGAFELTQQGVPLFTALRTAFAAMIPSLGSIAALFGAINLPLVAIIAGVALLAAGLYKLVGGWDGIVAIVTTTIQVFKDLWTIITVGFAQVVKWFQSGSAEAQLFRVAIGALMAPLQLVWAVLQKVVEGLSYIFKAAAGWLHKYADSLREVEKEQEKAKPKPPAPEVKNEWDALAAAMDLASKAMNEVVLANKAWLLASRGTLTVAQQVDQLKTKYEALGLTAADVAKQVELFFKQQDDAAKKAASGDKSPLQKMAEDARKLAATIVDSPIVDKIAEFGKEASKAAEAAARIKGGVETLPQIIKDIASAWDAAQLAKGWAEVWDATKRSTEVTASFRTQIAGMAEVIGNVGKTFLHTITLQRQMSLEGMTAAARRKQELDEAQAAEEAALAATTHLSDEMRAADLAAIRAYYEQKRLADAGYYLDIEKQAEAWGIKTNAMRAAEIAKEKAKLARMLGDLKTFSAAAIKVQQDKVAAMEAEGGEEERLKKLGIATQAAAAEELRIAKAKLDELTALHDPFYAAQIAKQQEVVKAAELAAKGLVATTRTSITSTLGSLADAFAKLATISGGAFGGVTKNIGEVVGGASLMATSFKGVNDTWKGLEQNGKSSMQGLTGSFKNMSGGALGAVGGLMKGLGTVMPMVGGIIAGISAAVQVGKKMWDMFTTSGGEKAVKEVGKKFGATISEEMGDAISKNAKEMFKGDRFAAELDKMKDLVAKAGGITDKNFTQQLGNLRQVFDLMNRGTYTQAQATKVLDENFGAFAKHVTESGKVASKEFTDIIALQQRMGTTSKEVTDFVTSQTVRLGKALGTLIAPLSKNVGELKKNREEAIKLDEELRKERDKEKPDEKKIADLRKELDALNETFTVTQEKIMGDGTAMARFERLTLAGFNAAVAGGASYLEAVEGIGPALDQLVEANTAMGRTGGEAIQSLLHFREVSTANKELVESSGALNEVMLALSNIGGLNVDTMADLQAQGMDTFNQLTAAGFTETEALQHMKGFLEGVRDAHKELGLPIDENTQALLDQATASGVLRGEQMSTNDIMIQGLGAIIKALKGDLPDAFKTMTKAADESATTVAGTMNTKVGGAIDSNAKKLNATPYASYAAKAVVASDIATGAIGGVDGAIEGVASGLAGTDWDGWARKAQEAAQAAYDAVNKVSQGESPGGIKEIPIELAKAVSAFDAWEKTSVASANAVKDSVDAVKGNSDAIVGMTDATDQRMVSMAERQAQNAAAMQQGGEVNISFNISALDGKSVQEVTEKSVIPAIIRTLNRGGEPRRRFMSSLE